MPAASGETSRPRTVVITYPYPIGEKAAGGPRILREVSRHLSARGVSVILMPVSTNALSRRLPRTPVSQDRLGYEQDEWFATYDVRVVRVPQNRLHYHLDGLEVRRAVARLVSERPVDIVLSHHHEGAFLPGLLRRKSIPFGYLAIWQSYADSHATLPAWRGFGARLIRDRLVSEPHRRADIIFAISRFTRQELIDSLGVEPERIVYCPLGVDPSFGRVPRAPSDKVRHFLYFGRVVPSKGFVDAIEALALVAERGNRDWKLRMIGEGRKEWARALAEERGIGELIELLDPVDDAGLAKQLEWSHLAIMPSHAESFGLSIAEAQAAGVPVVSYAVTAIPEVVADGVTGWLAPFGDVGRLAAAIEEAVADPRATHAMGLRARERALELFRWDRTAQRIHEQITQMQPVPH